MSIFKFLRNDEGYLNALAATRIADPTTAGDFCRRFDEGRIDTLPEVFNDARVKVWSEQPADFFTVATIDVDSTTVETTGECKQGMDINSKNQWGYRLQAVSLANTGALLYVMNRPGNRPSHEQAAVSLDRAVALCRRAGFRQIRFRGDTDFSQTEHLDRRDYRIVVVWKDLEVKLRRPLRHEQTHRGCYALCQQSPPRANRFGQPRLPLGFSPPRVLPNRWTIRITNCGPCHGWRISSARRCQQRQIQNSGIRCLFLLPPKPDSGP